MHHCHLESTMVFTFKTPGSKPISISPEFFIKHIKHKENNISKWIGLFKGLQMIYGKWLVHYLLQVTLALTQMLVLLLILIIFNI